MNLTKSKIQWFSQIKDLLEEAIEEFIKIEKPGAFVEEYYIYEHNITIKYCYWNFDDKEFYDISVPIEILIDPEEFKKYKQKKFQENMEKLEAERLKKLEAEKKKKAETEAKERALLEILRGKYPT